MWSSKVSVHPWVGSSFENPVNFKYKTLILGESNFTDSLENFNSSLVKKCVLNDLSTDESIERDTTGFCKFSTKIRRIIFGRDEVLGPNAFWQDVAFYNFVQSLVGNRARIRPTEEMWGESIPAFVEIVEKLKPRRIFVLGKENWNNLLRHIEHVRVNEHKVVLAIGSEMVTAGFTYHPSSSLSYSTWQPIAQELLLS